jgi:DNA-binding response OmpR family regulator
MPLSERRILCVDDDADSCELLEVMLGEADRNFIVKSATSAEKAIELIENESFDLYILDNWMPNISGVQLCFLIRLTNSETPILFYTAATRLEDREAAMKAGANEYLLKPNDLEIIVETVQRLLRRNPSQTGNIKIQ